MGASSDQLKVPITFTPVNRPPVGSVPPLLTLQDTELKAKILALDLDVNDTLSAFIVSLPASGTLKQIDGTPINSTPTQLASPIFEFKFSPAPTENGIPYANFSFYLFDGTNKSDVVVAVINVAAVNHPPIAYDSVVNILQDTPTTVFTLQAFDAETPNAISAIISSLPPNSAGVVYDSLGVPLTVGQTVVDPRTVQFTPAPLWYGVTSFQFSVSDGLSNSTGLGATVTLNVTHVNHAPTTTSFLGTATRTVPLSIIINAYDVDVGDNITITITSYSSGGGSFSFSSNKRALFPAAPFDLVSALTVPVSKVVTTTVTFVAPLLATGNNYASFSYYVSDQSGSKSMVNNVTVNIDANRSPMGASVPTVSVQQDVSSAPITLSGSDSDVADASLLLVRITTPPNRGNLYFQNGTAITPPMVISSSSVVSITYLTHQRGVDQFEYEVQDPLGAVSLPISVSVAITNTNHAPVAQWTGPCIGNEDTIITITQISAVDPDADDIPVPVYIASPPSLGVLSQADGSLCANYPCLVKSAARILIYTPPSNGNGVPYTTFIFYAEDSHRMRSANITGEISVTPVDDPPVATSSSAIGYENNNITVSLNVTDVDTPDSLLYIYLVSVPPSSLGVLVDQTGTTLKAGDTVPFQTLKFVPVAYANGNYTFSYRAADATSITDPTACSIAVIPVTQPPTCSVSLASPIVVPKSSSTSVILNAQDPDDGETYTFYLLSYQASDNTGSLTGPNGLITSSSKIIASVPSTSSITPVAVRYNVTTVTSLNISFLVSDGSYNSSTCYLNLVVAANQPPVAIPPPLIITMENTKTGLIVLNGTDADDDWSAARVTIVSLPTHGLLVKVDSWPMLLPGEMLASGVFGIYYQPGLFYNGYDTFSFVLTDASGMSGAIQTVTVRVVHTNHVPTLSLASILTTPEDVPLNISTINVQDDDVGDILTLILQSPPSSGYFTQINGTRITQFPAVLSSPYSFTFVPAPYANGIVTFTTLAFDGLNLTLPQLISINVTAVNNAPTVQDLAVSLLENAATGNFTLAMNDVDNSIAELKACILTLPPTSLGSVTYANGSVVSFGDCVAYPHVLYFAPAPYAHGKGALTFLAHDLSLFSIAVGIVNFTITHVNHAPEVSSASPLVATRLVELPIPLLAKDIDNGDWLMVMLLGISGGGVLSNSSRGSALSLNNTIFSGCIFIFPLYSPFFPYFNSC